MSDVTITAIEDGPYKVEGDPAPALLAAAEVEPPRTDRYFLCRCGGSSNKPFCDGTHNEIEFRAEGS